MNDIKKPSRSMVLYMLITLVVWLLIASLLGPRLIGSQTKEVDYGTFIQMTENKQINEVDVETNQIVFTDQGGNRYKTGRMDDQGLTERLYASGADRKSVV